MQIGIALSSTALRQASANFLALYYPQVFFGSTSGLFVDGLTARADTDSYHGDVNSLTGLSYASPSTKYVRGASGVLTPATTLRTNYSTALTAKGILIEGARTNLALYSEDLTNAVWTKGLTTISANVAVAPDGNTTADKIIATTTSGYHSVSQSIAFTTGEYYTLAYRVKPAGYTEMALYFPTSIFGATQPSASFLLTSAGTVLTHSIGCTDYSIEALPDGSYLAQITALCTSSASGISAAYLSSGSGVYSFAGDGTSGIYGWGFQVEKGKKASSYIKTTSAQVTRAADNLTFSLSSITFSATEGMIAIKVASLKEHLDSGYGTTNNYLFTLWNSASPSQEIFSAYMVSTTGYPRMTGIHSGATTLDVNATDLGNCIGKMVVFRWAADSLTIFSNGAKSAIVDSSGALPTGLDTLRLGAYGVAGSPVAQINGELTDFIYIPRYPTDAECLAYSLL